MTRTSMAALYEGVLHRSHLEARWAIFFRHLDLKAAYEPQGFVTDGEPYLPDFFVPAALGGLWVEIKPYWRADPEGVAKWRRFAAQRPQPSRAVLFTGLPTIHARAVVIGGDDGLGDLARGAWEDDTQEWRPCPAGYHFDLAYPGTFGAKFAEDGCPGDPAGVAAGEARIAAASQAALSHRFGKTPAPVT